VRSLPRLPPSTVPIYDDFVPRIGREHIRKLRISTSSQGDAMMQRQAP
jgi:hypothetical protein